MSPLFSVLKEQELEMVDHNKFTVMFKKGETIRKQGTFMSHVVSINSGLAKLYLEGSGFRNAIIRIVKPTNFIGGPGIYLDNMHHYTVTAVEDSTVCFIDIEVFKKIIDLNKTFAHEFMKDFSQNILSVYTRLLSLTQKQSIGRMADTMLYLFDEIFESNIVPLLFSKQDLADLSAMSKESAIQVLRQFNKEEIIRMTRDEMELLDRARLIRMSQFC
jgi:CRP-like cAMP-binding protein